MVYHVAVDDGGIALLHRRARPQPHLSHVRGQSLPPARHRVRALWHAAHEAA
ncbi:hypothetical protein LP420_01765 [Massilia sp. B-10]|nr:hypothetical protein LP420_01765 [Massilia sp. B-10]